MCRRKADDKQEHRDVVHHRLCGGLIGVAEGETAGEECDSTADVADDKQDFAAEF